MSRLLTSFDQWEFAPVTDPEREAGKVALMRIAVGLTLVWRCGLMTFDSFYYFEPVVWAGHAVPLHAAASGAQLALAIGLSIGVFPAVMAFALMVTHAAYSIWTGTYNLAPMLLVPMLGALVALETGRFSLTGHASSPPHPRYFRLIYVLLLLCYAGWNFQAFLYHVNDEFWVRGYTPAVLFTSSYLSEYYPVFRSIEAQAPWLFRWASALVVVLQSIFQIAMVPLVFTRWGLRFVRRWGWCFILGSLADLQLSILPVVEVIFWILVFVPADRWGWLKRSPAQGTARAEFLPQKVWRGLFPVVLATLLLLYFGNAISGFVFNRRLPHSFENTVLFYAGLVAPNVFNREDLSMGDKWVVLERVEGAERYTIPLNGPDGERLSYHRGDLLYFGNSLPWRRAMIDVEDLDTFHAPGQPGYEFARKVAGYELRRRGGTGPAHYHATVFQNRASDFSLGSAANRYRREEVTSFELTVEHPRTTP